VLIIDSSCFLALQQFGQLGIELGAHGVQKIFKLSLLIYSILLIVNNVSAQLT
jgi:hypothetical protein